MCCINPEQYAEYRRKQSEQIPPEQVKSDRPPDIYQIQRRQNADEGIRSRYRAIYPTDTAEATDRSADKLTAEIPRSANTAGTIAHNQNDHDCAQHPQQEHTAEA